LKITANGLLPRSRRAARRLDTELLGPLSRNSGIPLEELVSAVNVQGGIAAAIKQFDPEKGFGFATFAKRQIKWALSAYLRNSNRSVKVISLETRPSSDSDDVRTLEDIVANDSYDEDSEYDEEWRNDAREKVNGMLAPLNDRERLIVESRHGLNGRAARSLREIGADLRLSAERVRQIEVAAFLKAGLPEDVRP
jgi:RNA polymerase sigma factor (sigma-70 family)